MRNLKIPFLVSVLSIGLATPAFANEEVPVVASTAALATFTTTETQSLFEQDAQSLELATLSQTEMKQTEGAHHTPFPRPLPPLYPGLDTSKYPW